MWYWRSLTLGMLYAGMLAAQTAEELVSKNLQAKGGVEKLKAIHSLRMTGKMRQGSFSIDLAVDSQAPDLMRQNVTVMGMTGSMAYDGSTGWRLMPFGGRRDPEL